MAIARSGASVEKALIALEDPGETGAQLVELPLPQLEPDHDHFPVAEASGQNLPYESAGACAIAAGAAISRLMMTSKRMGWLPRQSAP